MLFLTLNFERAGASALVPIGPPRHLKQIEKIGREHRKLRYGSTWHRGALHYCYVLVRVPTRNSMKVLCSSRRVPGQKGNSNYMSANVQQLETTKQSALDQLCVNTIRTLSIDAVQKANSGHPGAPMGLAPVAYVLWDRILRYNPANPRWCNRDRVVLSAGHASMLLYSILHLTGYDLPLSEIERFRQLGSKCPGHPEYNLTPGVETTTGPLGQGIANSVGMAIAERWLAAHFNQGTTRSSITASIPSAPMAT